MSNNWAPPEEDRRYLVSMGDLDGNQHVMTYGQIVAMLEPEERPADQQALELLLWQFGAQELA